MNEITITVSCPACQRDNEVTIIIDSPPVAPSGMSGPPEYSDPGEGAEWHNDPVSCEGCHAAIPDEYIADTYEVKIQERIEEHYSDRYGDEP
jgi:hypothetical protein